MSSTIERQKMFSTEITNNEILEICINENTDIFAQFFTGKHFFKSAENEIGWEKCEVSDENSFAFFTWKETEEAVSLLCRVFGIENESENLGYDWGMRAKDQGNIFELNFEGEIFWMPQI